MEREQFEKLARSYRSTAADVARRIVCDNDVAEDIAQEVFLKLWNIRDSLSDYRSPESLIVVISRNMAVDYLRRLRPDNVSVDEIEHQATDISPEDQVIATEISEELDRILASLPDAQQSILRMRHIDGMETTEIAATIGSSEGAVRVALSRARHRVKELFLKNRI